MQQNRNRYSLFNAISAMGLTLVNGFLGIVVTHFVIARFGSDFNGLNSTANQIVNVLLIIEGGFTLASNVALFAPLTAGDYSLVNGVLAATKRKFRKIGGIFLTIGCTVAVAYAFLVNSALPVGFIITMVIMTIVPASFNLYYATTYRVLLQTQQKEYVISLIAICTVGLGHVTNLIMINLGGPMWAVRFVTMLFALLNSLIIGNYVKRKNPFLNLNVEPRRELIKGTGDVMAQKITGVIYNAAPIVFLSISPSGGTALASVYAVYNNVFIMLKSLLHGIIDAPRLGFGQMLTERKRDEVWRVYAQYEYAAFLAVFTLLSTACALILPFIKMYTANVSDINYYDPKIAILMVLIAVLEMIHIPSGHLINMAGEFRISRNFQVISCIVLLIGMSVGGMLWGVYGMLGAILCVACLLAVMEMGYVHIRFFSGKLLELMRLVVPLILSGVGLCSLELCLLLPIVSYFSFVLYGLLLIVINAGIAFTVGLIFNRSELLALIQRAKRMVLR